MISQSEAAKADRRASSRMAAKTAGFFVVAIGIVTMKLDFEKSNGLITAVIQHGLRFGCTAAIKEPSGRPNPVLVPFVLDVIKLGNLVKVIRLMLQSLPVVLVPTVSLVKPQHL